MNSHLHLIPPEIWSHIFLGISGRNSVYIYICSDLYLHSTSPGSSNPPSLSGSIRSPASVFASVCSHWREIALSTKPLWSNIHIEIKDLVGEGDLLAENCEKSTVERVQKSLNIVTRWIERLGDGQPIDFKLVIFPEHFEGTIQPGAKRILASFINNVLSCIKDRIAQWRNVSLTIPPYLLASLLPDAESDLPLLEHIGVDALGSVVPRDYTSVTLFSRAPQLKSVSVPLGVSQPAFGFPPEQLQRLQTQLKPDFLPTFLAAVLPTLSNLLELHLSVKDPQNLDDLEESSPLLLPHLQTLVLKSPINPLIKVLQTLNTPQVRSLNISVVLPYIPRYSPNFYGIPFRLFEPRTTKLLDLASRTSLTELTFRHTDEEDNDIGINCDLSLEILSRIPSLESMCFCTNFYVPNSNRCSSHVQGYNATKEFFKQLTHNPSSPTPPLAPRLKTLELCTGRVLEGECLVEMLKSRCSKSTPSSSHTLDRHVSSDIQDVGMYSVQRLESITMHGGWPGLEVETSKALDELIAEGLQVIWI